jgi:hypothetical protein
VRRVVVLVLTAVLLFLLWVPIPMGGGGVVAGKGYHTTRWGAFGFAIINTKVARYDAGDFPMSREVQFSWVLLAVTLALSLGVVVLGFWLWPRRTSKKPIVKSD